MALSGCVTTGRQPHPIDVFQRTPLVAFWNWTNVLLFSIANQRLVDSVVEDTINKPWRPLPSQRLSKAEARRLLLVVIPITFSLAVVIGVVPETLLLMVMTWMYNDLSGADESYIMRNLLNAFGITCYSSASTIIASGRSRDDLSTETYIWLGVVCGIIFTTLQIMDLADMPGDSSRGRKTMPLVHGENAARLSVILSVLAWSIICPTIWNVRIVGGLCCFLMGILLSLRTYFFRGVSEDKRNFKLWSLWTILLYFLPLFKRLGL